MDERKSDEREDDQDKGGEFALVIETFNKQRNNQADQREEGQHGAPYLVGVGSIKQTVHDLVEAHLDKGPAGPVFIGVATGAVRAGKIGIYERPIDQWRHQHIKRVQAEKGHCRIGERAEQICSEPSE